MVKAEVQGEGQPRHDGDSRDCVGGAAEVRVHRASKTKTHLHTGDLATKREGADGEPEPADQRDLQQARRLVHAV